MAPFLINGLTGTFTGATSAPTPVQVSADATSQAQQYVLTNVGSVTVFVAWGSDADHATRRAIIPTSTATRTYPLLAGTQVVVTGPLNAYFTGITSSGTAIVYVTPGIGP